MTQQTIRTIHVACKQLGLDEDTRKALQLQVVGKDSLGAMSDPEQLQVLAELKARGFKPTRRGKGSFRQAGRRDVRLIFVLWRALGEAGVLTDPSAKGLHKFVASRFEGAWSSIPIDINAMHDPAQIDAVIQALKSWVKREGVDFDWAQVGR